MKLVTLMIGAAMLVVANCDDFNTRNANVPSGEVAGPTVTNPAVAGPTVTNPTVAGPSEKSTTVENILVTNPSVLIYLWFVELALVIVLSSVTIWFFVKRVSTQSRGEFEMRRMNGHGADLNFV